VQGKAGVVTDLLPTLQEFYRDKFTALLRHQAGARLIGQYDINNTYQYVVNREDTQLTWLRQAITDLGGSVDAGASDSARQASGSGTARDRVVVEEDIRDAQAFVDRWRPRVQALSNARHRKMLDVILGETLEQKRFFEQAHAGNIDLLGKRTDDVGPRVGQVRATRWVE
jgi:hypothetical protein